MRKTNRAGAGGWPGGPDWGFGLLHQPGREGRNGIMLRTCFALKWAKNTHKSTG
jgi:hypothetical protein